MDTKADPTLRDLLLPGANVLSERLSASLDVGDEAAEIKAALAKAVPGLPLGPIMDGIGKGLEQALDVPVSRLLASGWDRARELRTAMQQTRETADAAVLVPLLDHTIASEHRPYFDVVIGDAPIARLVFPLALACHLEGVVLRIARGRITELMSGTLTLRATLKFADFVLVEKELAPIAVPGMVSVAAA